MLFIVVWIIFAAVVGFVASSRGQSGFGFFLLSLVLSPLIGILLSVLLPAKGGQAAAQLALPGAASAADEIKKLADLLQAGLITQNEYDAKKQQLLGQTLSNWSHSTHHAQSPQANRSSRKTIALYTVASIQVVAGFFGGFFGAFQILEALDFDGYVLIYRHNSLSIDLIVVVAAWCIVLGIGYVASRISSSSFSAPTFYHAIASISFGAAAVLFIHFVVPDIFSYVIDFGTRFFFQSVALVAGYWFGEHIRQRRAEN